MLDPLSRLWVVLQNYSRNTIRSAGTVHVVHPAAKKTKLEGDGMVKVGGTRR